MRSCWVLVCALLVRLEGRTLGQQARSNPAGPSLSTARGDAMIDAFLARQASVLDARFTEGATTPAAWRGMRPRLERELYSMLGLWPVPAKTPLLAAVTGMFQRDGTVVIEKLHFQSKPGLYVTANLYRPKDASPGTKLPASRPSCKNLVVRVNGSFPGRSLRSLTD